ncbi:MAG: TRAP transporter small permease [Chloroflexota bacterium]
MKGVFHRFWNGVLAGAKGIASLGLVLMVASSVTDITVRYVFNAPIGGLILVITDFLFPVVVFFSLPYVARAGANVRVEFMMYGLSPKRRRQMERLFALAAVVFWGVVMYTAAERSWEAIIKNYRPIAVFGIPIYVSFGIVAVGSLLALIEALVCSVDPGVLDEKVPEVNEPK